jgi:hypothetical protein
MVNSVEYWNGFSLAQKVWTEDAHGNGVGVELEIRVRRGKTYR